MIHKVYFKDSRCMNDVNDDSVNLIVTSPPYWSIKDYQHEEQIGYDQTYEEYLESMRKVIGECHRVLKSGCRMVVNIGDQYLSVKDHGRHRIQPLSANMTIIGVQEGFDFMGGIIWNKISTSNPSGGCSMMGSIYYPKDGHISYEHEYILVFRKQGKWEKPSQENKEKSKLTKKERREWFRGIWTDVAPERQKKHQAMFPVELPLRIIKMYSFYGETVLDPFLGSGTTTLAANMMGRNSIGYEINDGFKDFMKEKLDGINVDFEH